MKMECHSACDMLAPGLVSARHIQMLVVAVFLLLLQLLAAISFVADAPATTFSLAHPAPCCPVSATAAGHPDSLDFC